MQKKILLICLTALLSSTAYSQFYKSFIPSPEFSQAIEKIVLDFREDYKNIQGEIIEKGEVDIYESLIKIPGSEDCRILRFHSLKDTTAAWQATIYDGDDYNEAVKAYQNTFRQLKKTQIKWIDRSNVGFNGQMESPKEEVRFTTSTLLLQMDDTRYSNFEAQVEMLSTYGGFKVHLNLHKKVEEAPETRY